MKTLDRTLDAAIAVLAVLTPWVILLTLPIVDLGLFRQVETVAVALHGVAALACIILLLKTVTNGTGFSRGLSPATVAMALPGLAVLAMGLLGGGWPTRWHGTLEHGVGAAWHLETAILAVLAALAWRSGTAARVALAISSAGTIVAAIVLEYLAIEWNGELFLFYDFPEWLGLSALIAVVPLFALRRSWANAMALVILAAAFLQSGNRAAMLVFAAVVVAWVAFRLIRPALGTAWIGWSAAALSLIGLVFMAASTPLYESMAVASLGDERVESIASADPVDHAAIQDQPYGTLWQRSINVQVVLADLIAHPITLLTGNGYGAFDDAAARQGHWMAGREFATATATAALTFWDGSLKAQFHSHNLLLDALQSGGALAALAWLAMVVLVGSSIQRNALFAGILLLGTLVVGGTLWFFVNSIAPVLAIAIAATTTRTDDESAPSQLLPILAAPVLGLLAFVFTASTMIGGVAIQGERSERAFIPLMGGVPCVGYEAVTLPNADINRTLYEMLVRRIEGMDEARRTMALGINGNNLRNFSCVLRTAADAGDTLALATSLEMRERLVRVYGADNVLLQTLLGPDFTLWNDDLAGLLEISPYHEAHVLPYITWLEAQGDDAATRDTITRLAALVPEDGPVDHWLTARTAVLDNEPDRARAHLATALRAGLANLLPMGREAVDEILSR